MKTVEDTPLPHWNVLLTMPQVPFDDDRVKPLPDAVAVYVAHVPVVYQVPALIRQPFSLPLVMAARVPVPENEPPVPVGAGAVVVVMEVGLGDDPDLGRYFTPEDGQLELVPVTVVATKSAFVNGPLV